MLLNNQGKLYKRQEAIDLAKVLNSDPDEDWTYKVKHDPKKTGGSLIKIYDEENIYIGNL